MDRPSATARVSLPVIAGDPAVDRPRTWGQCVEAELGTRDLPCPYVGCKYHLALETLSLSYRSSLLVAPRRWCTTDQAVAALEAVDLEALAATCALRVAMTGTLAPEQPGPSTNSEWDPEPVRTGASGGLACTLDEVAIAVGVTRERARQIENDALASLRIRAGSLASEIDAELRRPDLREQGSSAVNLREAVTNALLKHDPNYASTRAKAVVRAKRACGSAVSEREIEAAAAAPVARIVPTVRVLEGRERDERIAQLEQDRVERAQRHLPHRPFAALLPEPMPARPIAIPSAVQEAESPPTEEPVVQRESSSARDDRQREDAEELPKVPACRAKGCDQPAFVRATKSGKPTPPDEVGLCFEHKKEARYARQNAIARGHSAKASKPAQPARAQVQSGEAPVDETLAEELRTLLAPAIALFARRLAQITQAEIDAAVQSHPEVLRARRILAAVEQVK